MAKIHVCVCMCVWPVAHVQHFAIPWTVACQIPLSMGFSQQEYWSGLPFPPPRDLPHPGTKPSVSCIAGGFFTAEPPEEPLKLF